KLWWAPCWSGPLELASPLPRPCSVYTSNVDLVNHETLKKERTQCSPQLNTAFN
uniref:Uncharacterized protein n=1 Tax=Poecilia formosa TaxID=48698 RepID=A0A096M9I6_POEFO